MIDFMATTVESRFRRCFIQSVTLAQSGNVMTKTCALSSVSLFSEEKIQIDKAKKMKSVMFIQFDPYWIWSVFEFFKNEKRNLNNKHTQHYRSKNRLEESVVFICFL